MRFGWFEGVGAALALAVAAGSGTAASAMADRGAARACYLAARSAEPDGAALRSCNSAIGRLRLDRRDTGATYINRGIVYMRAERIDKAIEDFDRAAMLSPDLGEAYVNKGIALIRQGKTEAAVALLDRGLALKPDEPEIAYYSRGVANELLGNTRAAYDDYREAAAIAPAWPEPREQLQRFSIRLVPKARA